MSKKETFSEILETKINREEELLSQKRMTENRIKEDKAKRIISLVYSQYKQAHKIIGERFDITQQHDTMFYFSFRGKNQIYRCKIYSTKLAPKQDFDFRDYSFSKVFGSKLKGIDYDIKLTELADNLIRWAKIVLKEELSLMEK